MAKLHISALGTFAITREGKALNGFRSTNAKALLIYLLVERDRPLRRESLTALLWPEASPQSTRINFRKTLSRLARALNNQYIQPPYLLIERETVQWNADSDYVFDVEQMIEAVVSSDDRLLSTQDDFLRGFSAHYAPLFEQWVAIIRENLRQQLLLGLRKLASKAAQSGDYGRVALAARRRLALDPIDEAAHRQLMQALALQGERNAALAQFDRCFEILQQELGVEPSVETEQLYEQIAQDMLGTQPETYRLPQTSTGFVGRAAERRQIMQLLEEPACRRLMITGAGGNGKTRLALEVAREIDAGQSKRVRFVAAVNARTVWQLQGLIATAFDVALTDPQHTVEHLCAACQAEPTLLVLDNIDGVIQTEPQQLSELLIELTKSAEINLLLTSRCTLHDGHDWHLTLEGLPIPHRDHLSMDVLRQFDAVQLFMDRAVQARISFALTSSNLPHITALCHLLAGSPLALELAAAQVAHYSVAEIVAMVVNQPEKLLDTALSRVPRHQSLQALFASAWGGLSTTEQADLMQLAIFAEHFSVGAAREIVGISAARLVALAQHSLLISRHVDNDVRFQIVPLLLPFLLRELMQSGAMVQLEARYANYYLQRAVDVPSSRFVEHTHLKKAWVWATKEYGFKMPNGFDAAWLAETNDPPYVAIEQTLPDVPIGRGNELVSIQSWVNQIVQDAKTGTVTVVGPAGIGKSHLMSYLRHSLGLTMMWLTCPCSESSAQALLPFTYWLRNYFEQKTNDTPNQNRVAFRDRFEELINAASTMMQDKLAHIQPTIAALLGIDTADSPLSRLQPAQRHERLQQALRLLIVALCEQQPVVLHIEDAHWLDDSSRQLLESMLHKNTKLPLAVVVTTRPEHFQALNSGRGHHHTLHLQPLSIVGVKAIAKHYFGVEPSAELLDLLLLRAEGNPFHVTQLLHHLSHNGIAYQGKLTRLDGTIAPDRVLPIDVHNLLVARLTQLDAPVRELVSQAAVLGHEISVPLLQHLVGREKLQAQLDASVNKGVLTRISAERYRFNHILLRHAAYDNLSIQQRHTLHQQTARILTQTRRASEYATLAQHYDAAHDTQRAASNYLKAGDAARDNYFIREAHNHYSRGLALAESDALRLNLYLGRERVNHWLGNREEQKHDLRQLVGLTADSADKQVRGNVLLRRSEYGLAVGDYDLALQAAQQAASLAVGSGNRMQEATAMNRWGRAIWQQGQPKSAELILKQALQIAVQIGLHAEEAYSRYDLSIITLYRGAYDEAYAELQQALKLFVGLDDKRNVARCNNMLGILSQQQNDYETALTFLREAVAQCQAMDWGFGEANMLGHVGNCYFELGDYVECRSVLQKAHTLNQAVGNRDGEMQNLDTIGLSYYFEGNLLAAQTCLEQALALAQKSDQRRLQAYTLTHLGMVLTEQEQLEAASICLFQATTLWNHVNENQPTIDSLSALAWLDFARGETEFAEHRALEVANKIATQQTGIVELPLFVRWQCFTILRVSKHTEVANALLADTIQLIETRAQQINNDGPRTTYLNKPHHRKLLNAWRSR